LCGLLWYLLAWFYCYSGWKWALFLFLTTGLVLIYLDWFFVSLCLLVCIEYVSPALKCKDLETLTVLPWSTPLKCLKTFSSTWRIPASSAPMPVSPTCQECKQKHHLQHQEAFWLHWQFPCKNEVVFLVYLEDVT